MLQIKSKKLLLGSCFFVLFITSSFGQAIGDYRSVATGTWTTIATWETHNGTTWVPAVAAPTATSGTITIQSPNIVSIGSAISNSASIIVNSGATLRVLATITFTNNAGGILTNNGTLINSFTLATATIINNGVINNNLTFTSNGVLTNNLTLNNATAGSIVIGSAAGGSGSNASAGTITNNGSLTIFASRTLTNNGNLFNTGTITTNGTLSHGAGSFYRHNFSSAAAATGTIPTSNWNATSTCEILACGNTPLAVIPGLSQTFGHFIWNNTTQPVDFVLKNLTSALSFVSGNMTIKSTNGNKLIFKNSLNGGSTTVSGSFNMEAGIATLIDVAGANTTFTLSAASYSHTGGTLNINQSSGILSSNTGNGTLTISGVSSISAGTLNVCSSSWVGAGGNGTFASGGLITVSGAGVLNGCSSNAVASGGAAGLITATSGITISGGTLNLNSSSTSGSGGSTVLNASGAVTVSGGTLNLAAGPAVASTGCNGTININSGGFTISSGTLNVCSSSTTGGGGLGILNVAMGNFVHSGGTVSKTGSNSGSININGSTAQTIRSGGFSAGHAISLNISQNTASTGATTINTGLTIANGTILNINDNSLNTADFTPGMNFTNNGVVNLNTSAELDMDAFVMSGTGSFSSFTNSLLLTKHATGISSTAALGCIQVTGTKTFASDGNYTYYGATAQVTGDGLPATLNGGILNIANTLAPAAGGVTLTRATTILEGVSTTGMLSFGGATNGRLITTLANLITIGDDVTVNPLGGSATKFVDGPIKKIGDDFFIFPTGDVYQAQLTYPATPYTTTAKWARIEISAPPNANDEFIAEYHKGDDPCNVAQVVSPTNGVGINNVSWKEYWELTRTSAAAVAPSVKLYWQTGAVSTSPGSAISLLSDLRVAECISSIWETKTGAVTTTGTAAASGTIISTLATTFTTNVVMPFTFGSFAGINPLPVEILLVDGVSTVDGNQIFWSTASETNNDYFNLERSMDGTEFTSIAKINGNGNSTSIINYEHLDANPFNGVNYYRLKQVDFDGNYKYSDIITIENNFTETTTIQVFPNPCQEVVNIIASDNFSTVAIYNMLGELVFSSSTSQNLIQFKPLADGIYVVKATTIAGKEVTSRFIKN